MRKYILLSVLAVVVFGIFFVVFLSRNTGTIVQDTAGRIKVSASFYPLYYFASRVGGKMADVVNLTPDGVEPHDYEPSAKDILRIVNSRLIIQNGSGLETWSKKVAGLIDAKTTRVLTVSDVSGSGGDPHIWLDPKRMKLVIAEIEKEFTLLDGKNAAVYAANATSVLQELEQLDRDFRLNLANCEQHNIVTSHAAFGHLAKAYRLTQIPITGLSPESEPSMQRLAEVTDFVRKNDIRYIFFEELVSPKFAQTLAGETGAQTLVLDPLEGISRARQAKGQNYFTVMRQNLKNLRTALSCK